MQSEQPVPKNYVQSISLVAIFSIMMKFKVKGKDRYETLENASFLLMGIGVILVIGGFIISTSSSNVVGGSAAILGSFLFFAFLVILILTLFVKEFRRKETEAN